MLINLMKQGVSSMKIAAFGEVLLRLATKKGV